MGSANTEETDKSVNGTSMPALRQPSRTRKRVYVDLCSSDEDERNEEVDITTSRSRKRVAKSARSGTAKVSGVDQQTKPSNARRCSANTHDKNVVDLTCDDSPDSSKKTKGKPKAETVERRLRVFRHRAPQSCRAVMDRALTQRMFVIERRREVIDDHPAEIVELAGSTGNIYTITIDHVPSCNCPHARKGNQCKHIFYVLIRVLKAPERLQYQLALTSSELREIFDQAPPLPTDDGADEEKDGKRKPVEDDCPICCCEFEPEKEEIVWCKAACGNNIHKACFDQWAAVKTGDKATCPYCRAVWQGDVDMAKKINKTGKLNEDGYVNVASQLGISGSRDYSTYHQVWARQQRWRGTVRGGEYAQYQEYNDY
ncbi:hypothetical protein LTR50_005286 [Elasticomyces elasticus]|nr:hypothetical protein LTR50_005286 [Elasticomyces elasticus]